jgi:hypothetical protein
MKELLFRILFGTIGMLVIYAAMAFYKLSLNPTLWAAENRFIVIIIGLIIFITIAIYPNYEFKKD